MSSETPHSEIFNFIATAKLSLFDDKIFNRLALNIFAYQFTHNYIYQNFCKQLGVNNSHIEYWQKIPAVTTSAFKHVLLTCFPSHQSKAVFHTSGTTQKRTGKHYFKTLDFYRRAMLRSFKDYCLPEHGKIRMLFLGPTIDFFPNSSLGFFFSGVMKEFGTSNSATFVTQMSLDHVKFYQAAKDAINKNESVFILGTAFSLLQCMDELSRKKIKLHLPPGSRILDTGGYKGRTREVARKDFHKMLCDYFGVSGNYLLNEYGMTELSSQFYESQLEGVPLQENRDSIKLMPPWVRVVAIDPDSMQVLPAGEIGMLKVYDLANIESVMAIQTEDLGRAWQDRIELIGRASGAELRGCSMLTEMMR